MQIRSLVAVGLCLFGSLCAAPLHGQQVTQVDATPICAECRIKFDTIAVVGSLADSVLISDTWSGGVLVLENGHVVVGGSPMGAPTLVFEPGGSLVRSIPATGDGPGELRTVLGVTPFPDDRILAVQGDRVSVLDRLGVVEFEARGIFRSNTVRASPEGRVLDPFGTSIDGREVRFRLFDDSLRLERAFGTPPSHDSECSNCRSGSVSWVPDAPDTFWTTRMNRHELQLWNARGDHLRTVQIEGADWFEPWAEQQLRRDLSQRPQPQIRGVQAVSGGLVWVMGATAAEAWEPMDRTMPRSRPVGEPLPPEVEEYFSNYHDFVLQLVNPMSGVVVAEERFSDDGLFMLPQPGLFRLRRQDEYGVVTLYILRARLERDR